MAKAGLIGRAATLLYNRTAGRRRPARIVHTYHGHVLDGYFSRAATAAIIQAERGLGRGTDRLIAISPRIERELVQRYRIAPASAFEVIPLGFDLAPLGAIDDPARAAARQALQIPDGDLVVSTVGRLTAIKNHELYLDAAEAVLKSVPRALFLIVGDGELRASLEASAATRGIAGRVRFLGWRRDLATVYGATDVFALTSRNEGTPVALIEAMAAGVPGVATDVGGVPDVICSPEIGVIAGNDGGAVAAALERLLASAAERRSIGDRARASVLSRYALPRLVDDIARLYAQLQAAGVTPRRQS